MENKQPSRTPIVSGIDALYFFAQSGAFYDRLYDNVTGQIERRKKEFEALNVSYQESDIIVNINGIEVKYSGRGRDGFEWFNHAYLRLGLKDPEKSPNIQNVRVQLNAMGIYTIGITALLKFVKKVLLANIITEYLPVTRIDLNAFVQHDFRYLKSSMVSSRKKNHSANITEHASGYELETFYVGKKPFKLRIYNKKNELKQATEEKRQIMLNHFGLNGLDLEGAIFNVEFELHREFLKEYGIDTVEDALSRAELLFNMCCNLIRLIDVQSISDKELHSSNRNRAKTLPIWQQIKDAYSIGEFLQLDTPLEKIEKIATRYSMEDASKAIRRILLRLMLHGSHPTWLYLVEQLQSAREDYELRQNIRVLHVQKDGLDDLSVYSDTGLIRYEERLGIELRACEGTEFYNDLSTVHRDVIEELERRGLLKIPF